MTDSLGWRLKLGVIVPCTNTVVQPEFDAMRPRGVTNHATRVAIPDTPVTTEEELAAMMTGVRSSIESAIDGLATCAPGHVVIGMSAETFWEGILPIDELRGRFEQHAGVGVTLGMDACKEAIKRYGSVKRIGIITPYMPAGDAQVRRSFTDAGFEVVNLLGLKCNSPLLSAHEPAARLRRAVQEVDDANIELLIQVGTNLAFATVAGEAEQWLGKPVLAANTCTYWHALRRNGIEDRIQGFGSLLAEY